MKTQANKGEFTVVATNLYTPSLDDFISAGNILFIMQCEQTFECFFSNRCGMLSLIKKQYKLYLQHRTGQPQRSVLLSVLPVHGSARGVQLRWMTFQPFVSFFTLPPPLCKSTQLLHHTSSVDAMLIALCSSM